MRLKEETLESVPVALIDPSPYQHRRYFDEASLATLAESIKEDGLIQPVVCRRLNGRYELIAGERRLRASKLAGLEGILSRVCEVPDHEARKLCLMENVHRNDLAPIEAVHAVAEWVDACLMDVEGYREYGDSPEKRVRKVLGGMDAERTRKSKGLLDKFIEQVKAAFSALNRPITWESFYTNDLPLLSLSADVTDVAIREKLNKSQASSLQKVKDKDPEKFKKVAATGKIDLGFGDVRDIGEASAVEIRSSATKEDFGYKEACPLERVGGVPSLYLAAAESLPLKDKSVDVIVTSPPYNIGSKKGEKREKRKHGRSGKGFAWKGIDTENVMGEDKYQEWQLIVLKELFRVAKNGASLFYNHKVRQRDGRAFHPMEWLLKCEGWTLRQEIIWDRGSTHNHETTYFWPHDERIYWFTKGKPKLLCPINQPTIWHCHGPEANTWHPSPFPEALPLMCLSAVGKIGSTVLDPFGGSMTTCRVALSLGMKAIGCDVNRSHIEKACTANGWNPACIQE